MASRNPVNEQSSIAPRFSLAGYVIVATPMHQGGVFEDAVCIVVEHTADRAIGLMLNRSAYFDPKLMPPLQLPDGSMHCNIFFGGPIEGPVLAIHDNKNLAEGGNNLGVYLACQEKNLMELTQSETDNFKIYIGHAVWGPKQLDAQVVEGGWYVLPAIPEIVFSDDRTMRTKALRIIGNQMLQSATGLAVSEIDGLCN
jgi:putative transcriptional regulator